MSKAVFLLLILVCAAAAFAQRPATEGSLYATGKSGNDLGACPLKNTAVKVDISGHISRVRVRQEFENTWGEPIEAVYMFPLSQKGAVDEMTMTVGERVIRGMIMRREEARSTYDAARSAGKSASLLDQERPNIFTQSVANIMPGSKVVIEISYVETLKYEDGEYEFVFPMTVGPRYNPAGVADAVKISQSGPAVRNGSDISIEVNLNAGVPVEGIRSTSHALDQINLSPSMAKATLRGEKTIPNKDFIFRYDVTGGRIHDAVLAHRDARGGFFTMILQPPDKVSTEDRTPKEIVFVLDTSGSMGGFPIEKAKEAMALSLEGLYPDDTFNLITFAGDTHLLFEEPVPATRANLDAAKAFLGSRQGGGGTEMMKAIKAALAPSDSQSHLRVVCFMTDGYVGNENEIIGEIQKYSNARVFAFGIGSSVNRFLLDRMASEGKGEVEYVALTDDGSKAAKRFYERVRTPLMTDLSVDWNGLPVADVYPGKLTDLFSAKPVVVHGRYTKHMSGTIRLRGKIAGQEMVREIAVNLPEAEPANESLAALWARTRIDDLASRRTRATDPAERATLDSTITNLGLEFGLMTNFTSFVAVEEKVSNPSGEAGTIRIAPAAPEGMKPQSGSAEVYKKWKQNEVAYIISTPQADAKSEYRVESLPINTRSIQMTVNAMASGTGSSSKARGSSPTIGSGSGGLGSGNGNGVGSGSGRGSGNGSAAATVDVSASDTTVVATTVTGQAIQSLPAGGSFTSLLTISPGFQVDGASASETVFVIDGTEITSLRPPPASAGDRNFALTGRALAIAEPEIPEELKKTVGIVLVEIDIDKSGAVTSARSISGPGGLHRPVLKAAGLSRFAPSSVDGIPVRVTGQIEYRFSGAEKATIAIKKMKAVKPTAAEIRARAVAAKLHHWLFAAAETSVPASQDPNRLKFVRDGKANVRVTLRSTSASAIERVRRAGFEMRSKAGATFVGTIPLDRLIDLAEIDEVILVIPQT